jgi:Family of unknown function (DUF6166)
MKNADWREYRRLVDRRERQEGCTMSQTYYYGRRVDGSTVVSKRRPGGDHQLNPRLDLWNHSPTGMEWGYGGSGPAQLALAILADYLQDDDRAIELHQAYKWEVIAKLEHASWRIEITEVADWLHGHDQAVADQLHDAGEDDSGIDLARPDVEERADVN